MCIAQIVDIISKCKQTNNKYRNKKKFYQTHQIKIITQKCKIVILKKVKENI